MFDLIEILKTVLFGIVEGITEWLPISSTGHLILTDAFIPLNQSKAFKEMFFVVIQLGAILAVLVLYWRKLNPFSLNNKSVLVNRDTLALWTKILVSCLPAAIIGLIFNDAIDSLFYNYQTVVITLIIYGVIFIIIERWNQKRNPTITALHQITYQTALIIGMFQLLALIPGTSRSGATIIGAMLIGTSRIIAAEYTFLLAVPVMFGASLVKLVKFGIAFTPNELIVLIIGMIVSFIASLLAIKFLIKYVQKHDFKVFGWYRVALGIVIAIIFTSLNLQT